MSDNTKKRKAARIEPEDSTAIKLMREFLKPGQLITGIELPTRSKDHVVQLLIVDPRDNRIKDITELTCEILGNRLYKCGIVLPSSQYFSVEAAVKYCGERLHHALHHKSWPLKNFIAIQTEVM